MTWYLDASPNGTDWAVAKTLLSNWYTDTNYLTTVDIQGFYFRVRGDVITTTMSYTPEIYGVLKKGPAGCN